MTIANRQHRNDLMFAYLPVQMKAAPRWLVHDANKRPFYVDGTPRRGKLDSFEDVERFGTFDEAVAALQRGFVGLGFALGPDGTGNHWQGVDFDRADYADLAATFPGYLEQSPSGYGCHLVGYGRPFATLGPNGSGVEAYAGGRYFTTSGKRIGQGEITCLADAVAGPLAALHGPPVAFTPTVAPAPPTAALIATDQTVADLRSALAVVSADSYDAWVRMGLALKCLDGPGLDLWLEWSQSSPKFDHAEALAKWNGFEPTSTGFRAVFAEAQRLGWQNPARHPLADLAVPHAVRSMSFTINGAPMGSGMDPRGPLLASASGLAFPIATKEEWYSARPSPSPIVANHFYADVGVFIAPGGTGKTTSILWQSVHIALGIDLWNMAVIKPGPVLILTAEDPRELLLARLRSICAELQLTDDQTQLVAERVRIGDVSGSGFRLTAVERDVVRPADEPLAELIAAATAIGPVLIVIDPAISFGVGEERVNSAEHALVEAGRRIVREVGCCVLYVHHSGKQNARDRTLDSYSGRGGSAFADGSRMVHVMQPVAPVDWHKETGTELEPGETGLILARPKGSYTTPQGPIFIRRRGYRFDAVDRKQLDRSEQRQTIDDQIWRILADELAAGRHHSANSLDALETGLKRADLRNGVARLMAADRVQDRPRPGAAAHGARKYLHPCQPADHRSLPQQTFLTDHFKEGKQENG